MSHSDDSAVATFVALEGLVEENRKLRLKYRNASSKLKQYAKSIDELESLKVAHTEQAETIKEQNAFLTDAAEEVENQDRQIKSLQEEIIKLEARSIVLSNEVKYLKNGSLPLTDRDPEMSESDTTSESNSIACVLRAEYLLSCMAALNLSDSIQLTDNNKEIFQNSAGGETEQDITQWSIDDWRGCCFELQKSMRSLAQEMRGTINKLEIITDELMKARETIKSSNSDIAELMVRMPSDMVINAASSDADIHDEADSKSQSLNYTETQSLNDHENTSLTGDVPPMSSSTPTSDLLARIEELESRNSSLIRKLDRESKNKVRLEQMYQAKVMELHNIKKLIRSGSKSMNNSSSIDDVFISRASSQSSLELHPPQSKRQLSGNLRASFTQHMFAAGGDKDKDYGLERLVALTESVGKASDAAERLLVGWDVMQVQYSTMYCEWD